MSSVVQNQDANARRIGAENRALILQIIRRFPGIDREGVIRQSLLSDKPVKRHLKALVDEGVVRQYRSEHSAKGVPRWQYALAEAVPA